MSLNPQDRKEWHGFLDLLQPPQGYRLRAAIGTTFGLSFDALVAALLAMCDAAGDELAANPVAATIAISRLASKVRVLTHPATITGATSNSGSSTFIRLLDRLIVQVEPESGLFHPKVWALRFEHVGLAKQGKPSEFGRLVVGSRNLTRSSSFELGAAFDSVGEPVPDGGSALGADVENALQEWLAKSGVSHPKPVWELAKFFRRLEFEVPHEAEDVLRLRWQGFGRSPVVSALPARLKRAVLVSPFIQPDFVSDLLSRTEALQVVSLPESLDLLPDTTIDSLNEQATLQGAPVLYQVTQHGDPDDAVIDGIHAKLLVAEGTRGETVTFVGSANATGAGWGLGRQANIEAIVEMRPGLDLDRFVRDFVREGKTKVHPWVAEYSRESRADEDADNKAERQMLAALREVAKVSLRLTYAHEKRQLTLSSVARRRTLPRWVSEKRAFSVVPMGLLGVPGSWRSLDDVLKGPSVFEDVGIAQLTAFVVLRGQNEEPAIECQRLVIAELAVPEALIDDRDEQVRMQILETADPAVVLNALIRGLAHVESGAERYGAKRHGHASLSKILDEVSLERLLHAVALDRSLVEEIRKLLAPFYGDEVLRLCKDLDDVVKQVYEVEAV